MGVRISLLLRAPHGRLQTDLPFEKVDSRTFGEVRLLILRDNRIMKDKFQQGKASYVLVRLRDSRVNAKLHAYFCFFLDL